MTKQKYSSKWFSFEYYQSSYYQTINHSKFYIFITVACIYTSVNGWWIVHCFNFKTVSLNDYECGIFLRIGQFWIEYFQLLEGLVCETKFDFDSFRILIWSLECWRYRLDWVNEIGLILVTICYTKIPYSYDILSLYREGYLYLFMDYNWSIPGKEVMTWFRCDKTRPENDWFKFLVFYYVMRAGNCLRDW